MGVGQFLFGLATASVSLFQEGARLFQFILEGVRATFADAELFAGIVTSALFFFKGGLDVLKLLLVPLDVLLCLSVSLKNNANLSDLYLTTV